MPTTDTLAGDLASATAALDASTREFLATLDNLTPEEWNFRPVSDRWSLGETAEHTAVVLRGVERLCRTRILMMPITGAENRPRVKDEEIAAALAESAPALPAPDLVKPKGRWTTPQEVVVAMQTSNDELIAWVRETTADLRAVSAPHPLFGPLDGVQWLWMLAAHARRHARQIVALRKSAK